MSSTKYVPRDRIMTLLDAMTEPSRGAWRLCIETGVRISDALNARAGDFDDKGRFTYTAQKTGKKGVCTVSQDFINTYVKGLRSSRYLFLSPKFPKNKNIPVTRQTVFNNIKRACKKCGYDSTSIATHTARKSFAVDLFHEKGLAATQQALQHGDVGTTLLYALSDNALSELRKRVEALEKRFEKFMQRFLISESASEACFDYIFGDVKNYVLPTEKLDSETSKKGKQRQKNK